MWVHSTIVAVLVSTVAWVEPSPPVETTASPRRSAPVRFEPGEEHAGVPTAVARVAGRTVILSSAAAMASRSSLTIPGGIDGIAPSFEEPLPGVSNYLRGDDRTRWRRDVAGYARVRFREVAPGIDLLYSGFDGRVHCELVVASDTSVAETRNVVASNSASRSARETVPDILFSTYFGGNSADHVQGLAVDDDGFIYVTGYSHSTDLPVNAPYQADPDEATGNTWDAFLMKFDPAGTIVFATYLGGSEQDVGFGVALDSVDNIYLTGNTLSPNFPTERAYQEFPGDSFNCFMAKLTPSGNDFIYSTYVGGNAQDGTVDGHSIAVDHTGSLYLTSLTSSTDFPATADFRTSTAGDSYDIFVVKLLPGGSRAYSVLVGGGGFEHSYDLAIDGAGRACVTGATLSSNYPTVRAFQSQLRGSSDAFVTVLDPAGTSIVCSSYLGGSNSETALAVEFDGENGFYVGGGSTSPDFPTRAPLFEGSVSPEYPEFDAFLSHFSLGGKLFESTLLGGLERDAIVDITLGDDGLVYIGGFTRSPDFPLARPLQSSIALPHADGFVAAIDFRSRELVFSTYLGGEDLDTVNCIRVDASGRVVVAGETASQGFPVVGGSMVDDTEYYNGFVTIISPVDPPPPPDPPHVDSIAPAGSAGSVFKLRVRGTNLQPGIEVFVGDDDAPWPDVQYRDGQTLVLRKGSPLRDRFPRGVPVGIRFRNPDGGETTATYSR